MKNGFLIFFGLLLGCLILCMFYALFLGRQETPAKESQLTHQRLPTESGNSEKPRETLFAHPRLLCSGDGHIRHRDGVSKRSRGLAWYGHQRHPGPWRHLLREGSASGGTDQRTNQPRTIATEHQPCRSSNDAGGHKPAGHKHRIRQS